MDTMHFVKIIIAVICLDIIAANLTKSDYINSLPMANKKEEEKKEADKKEKTTLNLLALIRNFAFNGQLYLMTMNDSIKQQMESMTF